MEIGSNFDLDINDLCYKKNNIFAYLKDYNYCFFASGRSAIKTIKLKKGKVLLPNYICDSVISCFNRKDIVFYYLDDNFNIDIKDLETKLDGVSTIFIMHYFGHIQSKQVLKEIRRIAADRHLTIIEDTTHSLLSKKATIGDYMVCSIRKWLPVTRGGVLYSKNKLPNDSKFKEDINNEMIYAMILKNRYLNGLEKNKEKFRSIFEKCENDIDNSNEVLTMSELSKYIASCCDLDINKKQRIDNYNYLKSKLKYKPINVIEKNECPFVYLIRIDDRNSFRKYLIKNNIYCPIHWPNCSKNELSIPIDNRYSKKEMDYIINVINEY